LPTEVLRSEEFVLNAIRERGPLTVAAFMDLALYDPELGYYARAVQRSGRAGDFFTSLDVGALFGEILEIQIAEMADLLADSSPPPAASASASSALSPFDLVEAGAGNARLSADILNAARTSHPEIYERTRLHLVETSAEARAAQAETLGATAARLASSSPELPPGFEGVLVANELFDAMPVHQVVMREDGLREVYVDADTRTARLVTREGPLSTPDLARYLRQLAVRLEPGWRVEINLRAIAWIREAARRLKRGFMVLIDYGHEARELYSLTHAGGTLTTFSGHVMTGPESVASTPPWLLNPGGQDITTHVDFTSLCAGAQSEGLVTIGFMDQTYFLLGLLTGGSGHRHGSALSPDLENPPHLKRRLALKTLLMPGGLGSTMKVLILGKGVGTPDLAGCSYRVRVT
jgi:SAM-dependent MidA family methyltransferase